MIFNSIEFLIFLPIIFIVYWVLDNKKVLPQNLLLLGGSYLFYGWWDWRFLILIAFSTILDFILGIKIDEAKSVKLKKRLLYTSLVVNLGILGFFKYFDFFVDSVREGLLNVGLEINTWSLGIILPVGISFYTFQTLSYSLDIYKGNLKPTKDFVSFATFVCFFPQLVAGPIERAKNLLPQFQKRRIFNYDNAIRGMTLIIYGFFKKVVIADRLAIYVDNVFDDVAAANSISLALGSVFFAFQIYCDFSGYSLIARGISKLLGFELMVNFNRPYTSKNIVEFWRRWHISLSTWFKDYVYIPLGGNRVSVSRNYYNIAVVFLVSGLWHGANWTFIVWGALHGVFQIIYLQFIRNDEKPNSKFRTFINQIFVFTLVCFAWIFFRADSVSDAVIYISKIFEFDFSINLAQLCAFKGPFNLLISLGVIVLLFVSYLFPKGMNFKDNKHHFIFSIFALFLIIFIGVNGEPTFIYFQF